MDVRENARTTRRSRMLMIERLHVGWSVANVADTLGVTGKTVRKWRDRYAAQGAAGVAEAGISYGRLLGKATLKISRPLPGALPAYRRLGFRVEPESEEPPYCFLEI